MQISIAIPNFNGKNLLEKNLPSIINSGADEVLVIDDGSKDESAKFLKENFPSVRLLINDKNLGFIPSVNKLFKEALGDIVVLLNNDVLVEEDFLKFLVRHFEDKKTFAVNCHERREGPSNAFWKDGFFEYKRGQEKNIKQKSSWASGGSAAYRKSIWETLGGFDNLFAPFYWEDVDISFRAIKAGFNIYWEPKALVYHNHETTIKKLFNEKYINWVKERNQLLFIWKNITDKRLISEHKKSLFKKLFMRFKIGYFIPFLWALLKYFKIKKSKIEVIKDQEAINYANTK